MGAHSPETAFWANPDIEPKRQYRFLMQLNGIEAWTIKKVNRPSYQITEMEHAFLNHKFYYPGRVEWQPISFTIVDPIMPDNSGILMTMLMASGYRFPESITSTRTISKAESVAAAGAQVRIQMLQSTPTETAEAAVIETWILINPWIKSVTMGDLDYTSDDMVDIEVEMRYDYAKLNLGSQLKGYDGRVQTGVPALKGITAADIGSY